MISEQLQLVLSQRQFKPRHIEERLDAYHIWGTIGIDLFLTRQGSVIMFKWGEGLDEDNGKTEELKTDRDVNAALTVASANIPKLQELLPNRPREGLCNVSSVIRELGQAAEWSLQASSDAAA